MLLMTKFNFLRFESLPRDKWRENIIKNKTKRIKN